MSYVLVLCSWAFKWNCMSHCQVLLNQPVKTTVFCMFIAISFRLPHNSPPNDFIHTDTLTCKYIYIKMCAHMSDNINFHWFHGNLVCEIPANLEGH